MKIKQHGTKSLLTNLFADYILSLIPKEESSVIEVADCDNFLVVKGKTSHDSPLNLSNCLSELYEKYKDFLPTKKIFNTIDLIEYSVKINPSFSLQKTLFNTENNSYNTFSDYKIEKVDSENYIVVSEFPHGYSLDQGRLLFYYLKLISYSIPTNYYHRFLNFKIYKEDSWDLKVFDECNGIYDNTLSSAIKDYFDFDMASLEFEMKKLNWLDELLKPNEEHQILLESRKSIIIV